MRDPRIGDVIYHTAKNASDDGLYTVVRRNENGYFAIARIEDIGGINSFTAEDVSKDDMVIVSLI
jgi:hypothetical protein